MSDIRTVIADKQKLFLEGLELVLVNINDLNFNIVNHAFSGKDLIRILKETTVDLIFLDLNLSDQDGFELIEYLKDESPKTMVCVLTSYRDPKYVKEAFQKGADGYFLKTGDSEELIDCVTNMKKGERFLSKGLFITPPKRTGQVPVEQESERYEDNFMLKQKLTKREQEVLILIVDAKNNRQIAQELFISDQTVGVHRKNIMRKLGVKNTISLIKFALEHSLT